MLDIADAPDMGAASDRFRPRLAADIEVLTPDMEPDPAFPKYTAVPLPVPMGAGGEAGIFAPPRPGALVVVGFAYGRQDHPIIRQIYGMGESLPQVGPEDMLLQQSPTVLQRADAGGNWTRETDAGITDKSVSRRVEAMDSETELARETKRISEHSTVEVDGASTLEVGTQLTMLSGKRADLGTLGEMNLTAGGDSTHSTGKNAAETVGGNHSSRVKMDRDITVEGGRTETVEKGQVMVIGQGRNEKIGADQALDVGGSSDETIGADRALDVGGDNMVKVGGNHTDTAAGDRTIEAASLVFKAETYTIISNDGNINLYDELLDCLKDIRQALDVLATHDHPETGTINQGGAVAAEAASAEGHRQNMKSITK